MKLWCEICGEAEQELHLNDCGICSGCFPQAFREGCPDFFWAEPCGEPIFDRNGALVAVCVRPKGTEHDHSSLSAGAQK